MSDVSSMRFIFNCRASSVGSQAARTLVEPLGHIVNHHATPLSQMFLVAMTQKKADEFAAANTKWTVSPETYYKRPDTRLKIVKPPSQD